MEDLWDDLAADPESVPVHEWQKQELARRYENLLKNPGLWSDLGRSPAKSESPAWPLKWSLLRKLEEDHDEAYAWYERQRVRRDFSRRSTEMHGPNLVTTPVRALVQTGGTP